MTRGDFLCGSAGRTGMLPFFQGRGSSEGMVFLRIVRRKFSGDPTNRGVFSPYSEGGDSDGQFIIMREPGFQEGR